MLQILIAILFFLLSSVQSKQTEDKIISFIQQSEKRIYQRIENLKPKEINGTFYVVKRKVNLHTKPSTKKSHRISVLYPNQIVTLLKSKNEWIYVEYFDYIDGIPRTGCGMKKYFKIVEKGK